MKIISLFHFANIILMETTTPFTFQLVMCCSNNTEKTYDKNLIMTIPAYTFHMDYTLLCGK